MYVAGPVTQGDWLHALGLGYRLQALLQVGLLRVCMRARARVCVCVCVREKTGCTHWDKGTDYRHCYRYAAPLSAFLVEAYTHAHTHTRARTHSHTHARTGTRIQTAGTATGVCMCVCTWLSL